MVINITENDVEMVKYFILEKGDITRWSSWEERKLTIAAAYPELMFSLHAAEMSQRNLRHVVENLRYDPPA